MIRLKGATREMGIVERASGTANSTHLFNIFSRPMDTCRVICCCPVCFSLNRPMTMPACLHTCVGMREEYPAPFCCEVTLSRKVAANATISSMYNRKPISEPPIDDSAKPTGSSDDEELIARVA